VSPQPDIVDRIATELDRMDPAPVPAAPPPPRRPPPRRKGEQELATYNELKTMPAALRRSAIAVSALILSRRIDAQDSTDRDATGLHRELRMHMDDLRDMAPGERKGDATDEVRARREARLTAVVGE